MGSHSSTALSSASPANSAKKFLLLRLHSLAGMVPLGLFMVEHFYSNSIAMLGAEAYDKHVRTLLGIPFLPVFEILFIFIPLLYHAVFGLYIAFLSDHNASTYTHARNRMFFLQRISGIVTLVFIVYHVWAFRLSSLFFGTEVNFQAVQEQLMNPLVFGFYVLGIVSTSFHFANGLWSGLITWGITVGARAQQASQSVAFVLFILFSAVGIATLIAF